MKARPPQFRYDPLEEHWIIVAAERSSRPLLVREREIPESQKECPFCPGREDETPPEIWRLRSEGSTGSSADWKIRVVPNKYPALRRENTGNRIEKGLHLALEGKGVHEVIIETPRHHIRFEDLPIDHIKDVLKTYRDRIAALYKDRDLKYVLIFKNHGARAGASLSHPHSQLIASTIIPQAAAVKLKAIGSHFSRTGRCLVCDLIRQEKEEQARVIISRKGLISFVPYAAKLPYEVFIAPENHCSCFSQIKEHQIMDLAEVLKTNLLRIKTLLNAPPYNLIIHTAPKQDHQTKCHRTQESASGDSVNRGHPYFHWHISIIPRLTQIAAFEWGSGFFINSVPPEDCAAALRAAGKPKWARD